MASTLCDHCHATLTPDMETCSMCGELTPLGIAKERRLHRRAAKTGAWHVSRGNQAFSLVLFLLGLFLMLVAIWVFTILVNNGVI